MGISVHYRAVPSQAAPARHATARPPPRRPDGKRQQLLSNISLNELDRFVEDTLGPMYNRGDTRRVSPAYTRIRRLIALARAEGDRETVARLKVERRKVQCAELCE